MQEPKILIMAMACGSLAFTRPMLSANRWLPNQAPVIDHTFDRSLDQGIIVNKMSFSSSPFLPLRFLFKRSGVLQYIFAL